ncbi:MAG: biotin/lipoate A/B protein ligase family protein [Anaerolineae bacterium]|jgi:lipoate-protein ligase A
MIHCETAVWRLIRSGVADGPTNMAVDEAILQAVASGHVPPTLRLYLWEPPCLSLGRAQPLDEVDRRAVASAGYDLVRRPTGGRAILHIDELTYSVVAPDNEPRVAGGVVESYRRLSAGLVSGLAQLGIGDVVADRRVESRSPNGPVCFEVPSRYEITVGGKKLVGSAQMRAQGVVLQHGAVPLHGDIARICAFLNERPRSDRVRARATTVEAALGRRVSWERVAEALVSGFSEGLNLQLRPDTLISEEEEQARTLRAEKYANMAWTAVV